MGKSEEKRIYRIIGQKGGVTISCDTGKDVSYEEAREIAVESVFGGLTKAVTLNPFILLPVTTEERWEDKSINFCPRCGENIEDQGLEQYGSFDCHACEASMEINIHSFGEDN